MKLPQFLIIAISDAFGCLALAATLCLVSPSAEATPKNTIVATIVVGSSASGIVVSPDSRFVYVADTLTHTVAVIDTSINQVTATVPGLGEAPDLGISPDGNTLYAAAYNHSRRQSQLDIISTTSHTLTKTVKLGSSFKYVGALAVKPDGTEVYVGGDAGDISVVDTSSDKVSKISLGSPVFDVIFTPDGKSAYASYNLGVDSAIAHIDTSSKTVVKSKVANGTLPPRNSRGDITQLAIDPTGQDLYVVDDVSGSQGVLGGIDLQKNKWVQTIYSKTRHSASYPDVTPDGQYLYFNAGTLRNFAILTVALPGGNVVGQSIPIGGIIAIAPNGNFCYVASAVGGKGTVTVIDISPE
jgi:YVTN family beta-propeller protein